MGWHLVSGPSVGHWAAKRLNCGYFEDRSQAIGLQKNSDLIAAVIYENWNGTSVYCHVVFEGRLTTRYLREVFRYPFIDCGVNKIIAPINSGNEKAQQLVKNMGFVEEARITGAVANGDVVFYTLTKQDCRFINHG
jgi:RimJ/RimL family protein N-acetyltransferase